MSSDDRREFLKKLAKTALYSAPVVHSFAAPVDLLGQGMSSGHKHAGHGHGHAPPPAAQPSSTEPAPWDKPIP